jgi:hypothetical protein
MFVILYFFPSREPHKLYEIQAPQNLDPLLVLDDWKNKELDVVI